MSSPIENLESIFDQAFSNPARTDLITRIQSAAKHQRELVQDMWQKVDTVLGSKV